MPTLFISYKRGSAAVNPLRERLRAAGYRTWYDNDDIHAGDNWRAAIDQGVDCSDAVVVGLTPAACVSEYVQYEVKRARDRGKPIFPVKLEQTAAADIAKLGLGDTQFLDFTDSLPDTWTRVFQQLLHDLRRRGLAVSRHGPRRTLDPDAPACAARRRYLHALVERVGLLDLTCIDPSGRRVELERVYVDASVPLRIGVTVHDWRVVNWWIGAVQWQPEGWDEVRRTAEDMGFERASLLPLIGRLEDEIAQYRAENPNLEPDKEYDANYTWHNRWSNGDHVGVIQLTAGNVAAACERLVVLGGPGSGKSTFVRHLALCLAAASLDGWTRPAGLRELGLWPHDALTPVYVELRRFVASAFYPKDYRQDPTADHLWNYVQTELLGDDGRDYAAELRLDLESGAAVLILDGLDEVGFDENRLPDRQRQMRELARSLQTAYPGIRMLVASRPYAYEGWTLPGFQSVTLAGFEDQHRIALAKRLYRVADVSENEAAVKAEALNEQLAEIDSELKDRPLFLTLMATIFLRGSEDGLPARKDTLYRRSIELLLDRWTVTKPGAPSLLDLLGGASTEALFARLAALAYDVHERDGDRPGAPEIAETIIYGHLLPLGRRVAAGIIPYLSENAAVLVSPGQNDGRDTFHFAHRSFQEYLAAFEVVRRCHAAHSFGPLRELMLQKPQTWREPGRLVGDVLADAGHAGDLWDLVGDLLA
ncbi:MAG: TIR domain-containing protein, partial [Capsulimonadaceae bacterium]